MPRRRHPELEGYSSEPLYVFELKSQRKKRRNRLRWMLTGVLLGVGLTAGLTWLIPSVETLSIPKIAIWGNANQAADEDPFYLGMIQAMNAAELTQTAEFREDWSRVAILWQQAIEQMRSVPSSHPNHAIAQTKLGEYTRNLQYAQSNVSSRPPSNPKSQPYWTLGSDRELVVALQGMPRRINQYDTLSCKEIMYYGDSAIELYNGYVVDYSDLDSNLAVLADDRVALSLKANTGTWTIGSSQ